jgi:hypothetical protein
MSSIDVKDMPAGAHKKAQRVFATRPQRYESAETFEILYWDGSMGIALMYDSDKNVVADFKFNYKETQCNSRCNSIW